MSTKRTLRCSPWSTGSLLGNKKDTWADEFDKSVKSLPRQSSPRGNNRPNKMGTRLTKSLPLWELIHSDPWVLDVLCTGYRAQFLTLPPLTTVPQWFSVSPEKTPRLIQEIDDLREKDAIELVLNPGSPGFYSRIFLIPNKNGKLRLVFHLSPLNQYLIIPKF